MLKPYDDMINIARPLLSIYMIYSLLASELIDTIQSTRQAAHPAKPPMKTFTIFGIALRPINKSGANNL